MKSRLTPIRIAVMIAAAFASAPATPSSIGQQADDMFNNLGTVSNYTPPGAYQGQTLHTYTGGNLFIRAPNKTYQLLSFKAPSISAGCGGIDAFGGSFSHISAAQFKNMLKTITSNIPGVIFDLAIKSVEPLLGSTMDQFKTIETMLTRGKIGSCDAAKALVGAAGDVMGVDRYKTCEAVAVQLNLASDAADAGEQCKDPAYLNSTMNSAKADSTLSAAVPYTGNIVWDVLSSDQNLDKFDKLLIMSITGTTIYYDPGANVNGQAIQSFDPVAGLTASALIGGTDGSGIDASGNINLQLYTCNGACVSPDPSLADTSIKSLKARVIDVMTDLSGAISGNQPPSPAAVNFVNNVPVPVYQLLAVANSIPNAAIPTAKINQYSEYIAVEFAYALLSRAVAKAKKAALPGGSLNGMKLSDEQRRTLQLHANLATQLETSLNAERQLASVRAQSFISMAQDIEQLQRSMRTIMPQQITNMLGYARANPAH